MPTEVEVLPAKAMLFGPQAADRLVVIGAFSDGSRLDLTSICSIPGGGSQDRLGRSSGFLHPVADGKAEVVVRVGPIEVHVPV